MTNKHLRLGLFGFGVVGQGLYGVLNETTGLSAEVAKICVKNRGKKRPIDMEYFTFDKEELLKDPEIDVIVELIDTSDEAFEIVKAALQQGKAVVTANKKMVAEHYEELVQLQAEHGQPLLYEASSAGSIPIIRNLEEYYDNDLLSRLEGIMNGTCNYILTRMFDEGVGYEPVLAEAQDLGFAESDPTLDVDGFDAKYKLVITTGHAFGVFLNPEEVVNIGIRQISAADFQYAREKGYKIQLVATSRRLGDNLVSFVLPQFVPEHHLLHGVTKEFNGIVVGAAFAEEQFFLGKGAGGYPTASAVLSDISALSYGYRYSYKKRQQGQSLSPTRELPLRVYLRFATGSNAPDRLGLQNVEVSHEEADLSYAIGTVELATLVEQGSDLRHEPIIPILMPEQPSMGEDDTVKASLAAAQALHS